MRKVKSMLAVTTVAVSLGTQGLSETLSPPAVAEDPPRGSFSSSVGPTEILISVLALLLVWAAYDQNVRANAD